MKNQNRVWIHCRVYQQGEKCLLDFQENLLKDFADALEMKVVGVTKEVSSGKNFESFECKKIVITAVRSARLKHRMLVFQPVNIYYECVKACMEDHRKKELKRHDKRLRKIKKVK